MRLEGGEEGVTMDQPNKRKAKKKTVKTVEDLIFESIIECECPAIHSLDMNVCEECQHYLFEGHCIEYF